MSDPVSNVQIEDVLSSIRRLVAQGDKAKREKRREYGDDNDASAPVEKLVLTPALRISEGEDQSTGSAEDAESDVASDGAFVLTAEEHAVDRETEALKDIFVGEPHQVPETPDLQSLLGVRDDPLDFVESDVDAPEDDPVVEAVLEDVAEEEADVETAATEEVETSRASLEATIAALEAAVTSSTEEFEPDGSEVAFSSSWEDDAAEEPTEELEVAPVEVDEVDAEENDADDGVLVLRNFVSSRSGPANDDAEPAVAAEESEFVASDADMIEPDVMDEAQEVDAVEPIEAKDTAVEANEHGRIFRVVPDQPVDEPKEEAVAGPVGPSTGKPLSVEEDDFGDEMIGGEDLPAALEDDDMSTALAAGVELDEEVLKEIVSQVLKGELEGKLGETITRNVRRLVRREINRVLTHQELQ